MLEKEASIAEEMTQLAENLPNVQEALGLIPIQHKLSMVVHGYSMTAPLTTVS